jgi:kanamycin kinase
VGGRPERGQPLTEADLPASGRPFSGRPDGVVPVPAAVRAAAGPAGLDLVWLNEIGGLTFAAGQGPGRRFIKWTPAGSGLSLDAEAARLAWAGRYHPVPRVLDQGRDDDGEWLVTAALDGENAVSPRWKAEPATAVAAIGAGLRALHDALPVAGCPFTLSLQPYLEQARRNAAAGRLDPRTWHPVHQSLTVTEALDRAAHPPPADRLVVCHGDACAPNTLLGADGRWSGHVDLGDLGVADRWADLAVATWSTEWNYGPHWERPLLDAYGTDPDPERSRYYRLLWDLRGRRA